MTFKWPGPRSGQVSYLQVPYRRVDERKAACVSVLKQHFLDIPAFPLHLVGCCCIGNDKGAALTPARLERNFSKPAGSRGQKTAAFQFFVA
jgi:hypothetical protein